MLANNCTDDSAEICRAFARQHPNLALQVAEVTLPTAQATVGHARRLLMEEPPRVGLPWAAGARVIASTDGDTRVAPDWLAATRAVVGDGADAVAGRILLDSDERGDLDAGPDGHCSNRSATPRRWRSSRASDPVALGSMAAARPALRREFRSDGVDIPPLRWDAGAAENEDVDSMTRYCGSTRGCATVRVCASGRPAGWTGE